MLVVLVVALLLLAGILGGCVLIQQRTITLFKQTMKAQTATEHRLAADVRVLQEELIHHAAVSQVVVLWRNRNLSTEREGNRQ